MKRNSIHSVLSVLLCMVLIAAMALFAVGCTDSPETPQPSQTTGQASGETTGETQAQSGGDADVQVLGEGANTFTFTVVDLEGIETVYEIHTDETIVGTALMGLELIDGEEGPYGLYVKTVCGTKLDYDTDGKYWGFYVDGEYGLTGVDTTEIVPGTTYTFKAE